MASLDLLCDLLDAEVSDEDDENKNGEEKETAGGTVVKEGGDACQDDDDDDERLVIDAMDEVIKLRSSLRSNLFVSNVLDSSRSITKKRRRLQMGAIIRRRRKTRWRSS